MYRTVNWTSRTKIGHRDISIEEKILILTQPIRGEIAMCNWYISMDKCQSITNMRIFYWKIINQLSVTYAKCSLVMYLNFENNKKNRASKKSTLAAEYTTFCSFIRHIQVAGLCNCINVFNLPLMINWTIVVCTSGNKLKSRKCSC